MTRRASSTVAAVSGALSGLGFPIARELGAAGQTVLVGSRGPIRSQGTLEPVTGEDLGARRLVVDATAAPTTAAAKPSA